MHYSGTVVHDLWHAVSANQIPTARVATKQEHQQRTYRSRSVDDLCSRTQHPAFSEPVKKSKKSPNIFTFFRRRRSSKHLVFGLPLSKVCDENLDPPEPIIKLMVLIYQQGPQTPGILRRGSKATLSKEIRDKIDAGEKYFLEDHMAPTAASVFKEFLRCIPEGLLVNDLYQDWTTIRRDLPRSEMVRKIRVILTKLPPAHYRMVSLTICLLQHLAKYSSQNHMGPSNLAMCIAPSFCACEATSSPQMRPRRDSLKHTQMEISFDDIQKVFVPLITFMIVNHTELFGEGILTMFTKYGCRPSPAMNLSEEECSQSRHISEKHCLKAPSPPQSASPSFLQQAVDNVCRSTQKLALTQETNVPRGRPVVKVKSRMEVLYCI